MSGAPGLLEAAGSPARLGEPRQGAGVTHSRIGSCALRRGSRRPSRRSGRGPARVAGPGRAAGEARRSPVRASRPRIGLMPSRALPPGACMALGGVHAPIRGAPKGRRPRPSGRVACPPRGPARPPAFSKPTGRPGGPRAGPPSGEGVTPAPDLACGLAGFAPRPATLADPREGLGEGRRSFPAAVAAATGEGLATATALGDVASGTKILGALS
ncbi:hypothetical protein NL676_028989 [Syzygium grande]|nr:hypothetical protein NL676_028989 [Syzygium grande]